jgi:hypothetical protein
MKNCYNEWFIGTENMMRYKWPSKDTICRKIYSPNGVELFHFIMPYNNKLFNAQEVNTKFDNIPNCYMTQQSGFDRINQTSSECIENATDELKIIFDIKSISNKNVDYLDFGNQNDMISYMPTNKLDRIIKDGKFIEDPYNNRYRNNMRFGKFFTQNTLLDKSKITHGAIVKITEIYKSINTIKTNSNIEIIDGEEMRKWYLENNYTESNGTLNKSCMRYQKSQDRFDIYTLNKEVVKMAIRRNDKDNTKIIGRALIWKTNKGLYMDRIYVTDNLYLYVFLDYAKKHNMMTYDNNEKTPMHVKLKVKPEFNSAADLPYMDTFKYYDFTNNILYNKRPQGVSVIILNDFDM